MGEPGGDTIQVAIADGIALITIDRAPVNALPHSAWAALAETLDQAGSDESVRAVVLTGGTGRFCAGADIEALIARDPDADPAAMLTIVADAAHAIGRARVPVIAAIDGPAHGGGLELALGCDLRIASGTSTFSAAGVNMGLIASVGSLVTSVGDTIARRMLLTGERVDAASAQRFGIITDIVDDPLVAAMDLARLIATKPPLAIEATKSALNQSSSLTPAEQQADVTERFRALVASADHREAIQAFKEKRAGHFNRE